MSIYNYLNESLDLLEEKYIFNEKDIYYNKDKFDSGSINLCFITGHSGSGKSTMAHKKEEESDIEAYELDDLLLIKDHFTMSNLKEYGDLIYSFFNGPGKKYYITYKDLVDNKIPGSEYEDKLYPDFVHYAMKYASTHKNKRFILEGVWLFCTGEDGKNYFKPEEFKDYAFYIKGTSMIISKIRAAKRDAKNDSKNKREEIKAFSNNFFKKNWKWYMIDEKRINVFRDYFKKKIKYVNEATEVNAKILYHLSQHNLDGKLLKPSIPSNYFTKNGYEDGEQKRVCFAPSIDKCLRALSQKCINMELYAHVPVGNYKVFKPSVREVPDSKVTGELWITEPVKVKCIGKIKVIGDKGEDGLPFSYGDKTAELYDWEWEWIERYNTLNESKDVSTMEDGFKKKSGYTFKIIPITDKSTSKYFKDGEKERLYYINKGKNGEIAICNQTKEYAGYIMVSKNKYIGPFLIDEKYRGYGLSSILLKDAIEKYGGNKLGVYDDNEVAISLYKKFGFKVVDEKKYSDGDTVLVMELDSSN